MVSFRELANVLEEYHRIAEREKAYFNYVQQRKVWDNLGDLTQLQVRNVVVAFPNTWSTRIPYDCVPQLTKKLKGLSDAISRLRNETLLEIVFEKKLGPEHETQTPRSIIKTCFDALSKVKAGRRDFGFTGTSKVLHMIVPELFVMCDHSIASGYGYAQNSTGYGKFLEEMQQFSRSLVDSCKSEHDVGEADAIKQILALCPGGGTLTKIIDEFNYLKSR